MKLNNTAIGLKIPKVQEQFVKNNTKIFPIDKIEINNLRERGKEKLQFSYRFLDRETNAFNLGGVKVNWYIDLIDTLKEVSNLTRNQLMLEQRNHYDPHKHDWDKLDYKFSFDDNFLEQVECLQFRISKSKGRVHGFIIGNIFYIVWLDRHHNLYPSKKHGGRKILPSPKNSYEILEEEFNELKLKLADKEKELDDWLSSCEECERKTS